MKLGCYLFPPEFTRGKERSEVTWCMQFVKCDAICADKQEEKINEAGSVLLLLLTTPRAHNVRVNERVGVVSWQMRAYH